VWFPFGFYLIYSLDYKLKNEKQCRFYSKNQVCSHQPVIQVLVEKQFQTLDVFSEMIV